MEDKEEILREFITKQHLGFDPPSTATPGTIEMENLTNQRRAAATEAEHMSSVKTLTYVDFTAECLRPPDGPTSRPGYETFPVLVRKANSWLRENPEFLVKTCESVDTQNLLTGRSPDTTRSVYTSGGIYNRSLRMWIMPKSHSDSNEPVQIGYMNFMPAVSKTGDTEFQSLNVLMRRINGCLRESPIPGWVLNMECQRSDANPDSTCWELRIQKGAVNPFVWMIRIFYIKGQPRHEEIGWTDFVPKKINAITEGEVVTKAYQKQGTVLGQAFKWIKKQTELHVTNIQSINIPHAHSWGGVGADATRSSYPNPVLYTALYVRIIRVFYTRSIHYDDAPPLKQIAHRTFIPGCIRKGGHYIGNCYESQLDNLARLRAWTYNVGANILSAETIPVVHNHLSAHKAVNNPDQSATWDVCSNQQVLLVTRIYTNGSFSEPPAGVLPSFPPCERVSEGQQPRCCCSLM